MNLKIVLLTCLCTPIIANEIAQTALLQQVASQKPVKLSPADAELIREQLITRLILFKPFFSTALLATAELSEQDWAAVQSNISNIFIPRLKNNINLIRNITPTKEKIALEKSRLECLKLLMQSIDKMMPHWLLENEASETPVKHPGLQTVANKYTQAYVKPVTDLFPEYEDAIKIAEDKLKATA